MDRAACTAAWPQRHCGRRISIARCGHQLCRQWCKGLQRDGVNLNLQEQVLQFTNDFGGVAPGDALYVMEMGSNDVRDALQHYLGGDAAGGALILQQALTSIGSQLGNLYQLGGRRFFVWNVPDLSLTPALRRVDQASGTGTAPRSGADVSARI